MYSISQCEVGRQLKKSRETGNVRDRQRSGRPRKTTTRQDHLLLRLARRNRSLPARGLRNEWQPNLHGRVSRKTVNRRLFAAGFNAYRPRR